MATNHSVGERDWYRVLGVDRQAGGDTIRVAYRELAWRLHPDRQQSPAAAGGLSHAERRVAERRMREVNEAFRVLGEPARRRAYDHGRFGAETPKRPSRSATGRAERPRRTVVEVPDDHGDDLVDVAGDGVHGLLFSRLVPAMVAVLLLGIVVFSAFAGGGVKDPSSATPGCVLGNTLVDCAKPNEGRIVGLADSAHRCPDGSGLVRLAVEYCVES
ncbi:J domain-containing protein [Candidatus Microthrix parvicella]|uniref:J domain-containing protein n=1 Tax=Candidatus Neomicrothrix parvicella RN1 TaxID=1229780 RepID=R4Z4Q6_9ACTN|nr:J domain-containing protein [Candidatus Microthrix parvicella]CCM65884.1 hypothetical protein BN381_80414 [Candidatus Microthrix parvicella RN1]